MTVASMIINTRWVPKDMIKVIVDNDLDVSYHSNYFNAVTGMRFVNKNNQEDDYIVGLHSDLLEAVKVELRKAKIKDLSK